MEETEGGTEGMDEALGDTTVYDLKRTIEELIERAANSVLGDRDYGALHWQSWKVILMGSREYGLATDTSDYDFVLPLGEAAAAYAKEIRQRFMAALVSQKVSSKQQIRHEVSNDTVKWRDQKKACYVSLNVSHESKTRDALAVTAWLKAFYCEEFSDWRAPVMEVATKLRQKGHMAVGKMAVADTLKSPPMALLCAALISEHGQGIQPSADFVYRRLLQFPAESYKIVVDLERDGGQSGAPESRDIVPPKIKRQRRLGWQNMRHALLVTAGVASGASDVQNMAWKLSEPRWCALQMACVEELQNSRSILESWRITANIGSGSFELDDNVFAPLNRCPVIRRRSFMVKESTTKEDVAVVVNFWQVRGRGIDDEKWKILVVLTGDSNDRWVKFENYHFVVIVMWSTEHRHTTRWLLELLIKLHGKMVKQWGEDEFHYDLLGLSRGHCALMNAFEVRMPFTVQERVRLQILTQIRYMIGAGGCIFRQHSDPQYEHRIASGINYITEKRKDKGKGEPFRLIVVSRLDGTTRYAGDWAEHKETRKAPVRDWVTYFKLELYFHDGDVKDLRVLNVESHGQTLHQAQLWTDELCLTGKVPEKKGDVLALPVLNTLVQFAQDLPKVKVVEKLPVPTGREVKALFPQGKWRRGDGKEWPKWRPLTEELYGMMKKTKINLLEIGGPPASGKSTTAGAAVLGAAQQLAWENRQSWYPCDQTGVVQIMTRKEASNTTLENCRKSPGDYAFINRWNGDHKESPVFQDFTMLVTPQSLLIRMIFTRVNLASAERMNVQHWLFDEVHEADCWTLLLLVIVLNYMVKLRAIKNAKNERMTIALMTATKNTAIYKSIKDYIEKLPALKSCMGKLEVKPAQENARIAADRRVEITAERDELSDSGYYRMSAKEKLNFWLGKMIRKIAVEIEHEKDEIGKGISILVIVAGESEMEKLVRSWKLSNCYRSLEQDGFRIDNRKYFGGLHANARQYIRERLKRNLDEATKSSVVIAFATGGIAEAGITLVLNGVIDMAEMMLRDINGFLRKEQCTEASTEQRKGRAGRTNRCWYKRIAPDDEVVRCEGPTEYTMPLGEVRSVVFVAVGLQLPTETPLIGVSDEMQGMALCDLERMGAIERLSHGNSHLTILGRRALALSFDVEQGMFLAICEHFGIPVEGKIAVGVLQSMVFAHKQEDKEGDKQGDTHIVYDNEGLSSQQMQMVHTTGLACDDRMFEKITEPNGERIAEEQKEISNAAKGSSVHAAVAEMIRMHSEKFETTRDRLFYWAKNFDRTLWNPAWVNSASLLLRRCGQGEDYPSDKWASWGDYPWFSKQKKGWEVRLTLAAAVAYGGSNTAICWGRDKYMTTLRSTDKKRCDIMKSELNNPEDFNMSEEGEEVRLQSGEPCCSINNDDRNSQWGFFCARGRHPNIKHFMAIPQWVALLVGNFQSTDNEKVPLRRCREGLRRYLNMDSKSPCFREAHLKFWRHFVRNITEDDLLEGTVLEWYNIRGENDGGDEEVELDTNTEWKASGDRLEIPAELLEHTEFLREVRALCAGNADGDEESYIASLRYVVREFCFNEESAWKEKFDQFRIHLAEVQSLPPDKLESFFLRDRQSLIVILDLCAKVFEVNPKKVRRNLRSTSFGAMHLINKGQPPFGLFAAEERQKLEIAFRAFAEHGEESAKAELHALLQEHLKEFRAPEECQEQRKRNTDIKLDVLKKIGQVLVWDHETQKMKWIWSTAEEQNWTEKQWKRNSYGRQLYSRPTSDEHNTQAEIFTIWMNDRGMSEGQCQDEWNRLWREWLLIACPMEQKKPGGKKVKDSGLRHIPDYIIQQYRQAASSSSHREEAGGMNRARSADESKRRRVDRGNRWRPSMNR